MYKKQQIRPFIGAADFNRSRSFYADLGFTETLLNEHLCLFTSDAVSFYLQHAYVKDWVDNTMIFVEVDDADRCYHDLEQLPLNSRYPEVRLEPVRSAAWGRECFLHDPSGILWHFGTFHS